MKFVKKPIVVEAEQFLEGKPLPPGVMRTEYTTAKGGLPEVVPIHVVQTKQAQRVPVAYGEWIVKEPDGSGYYPVSEALFPSLFDPHPDEPEQHDPLRSALAMLSEMKRLEKTMGDDPIVGPQLRRRIKNVEAAMDKQGIPHG